MLLQKGKFKKGDIVIPFDYYSNGYDVTNLEEAVVIRVYTNEIMTIKCIKGFIRKDFNSDTEFTVNPKEFMLKIPKTISDYEIY